MLHYLIIGNIFGKKTLLNIKYDLIFFTALSETFFILRRRQRDIIDVQGSSSKVPVFLFRFKSNLKILDIFSKNSQTSNLMKILPVGAELFHAKGQTDMTRLIVAFRNFANSPKNVIVNIK